MPLGLVCNVPLKKTQVHAVLFSFIFLIICPKAVYPEALSCCSVNVILPFRLLYHHYPHILFFVASPFEVVGRFGLILLGPLDHR